MTRQPPRSLEEAKALYLGRAVSKEFEDPSTGELRPYSGKCVKVHKVDGVINYQILYPEDGDGEDLSFSGLQEVLVESPAEAESRQRRADRGHPPGQPAAKTTMRVKRERADSGGESGGEESEEAEAQAAAAEHGLRRRSGAAGAGARGGKKARAPAAASAGDGGDEQGQAPKRRRQSAAARQAREEEDDLEEDQQRDGGGSGSDGGGEPPARKRGKPAALRRQRGSHGGGGGGGDSGGDSGGGSEGEGADEERAEDEDEEGLTEGERIARAQAAREASGRRGAAAALREKGLAGHVKSVHLVNFMCHRNFQMEFSSHVNFVSGQNGSGKSAVLQALQICLGATARETGRGTNLRELVRTGASEAKISVTLWNTGSDAYEHARLGDWVTIERTLKVTAGARGGENVTSTWRVLCEKKGKVDGATRKGLIDPLLDHLNIAAENPLCVMTQDKAREFLCSASESARMLYKLFMEATHMADFKDKLQRTKGLVVQMRSKVTEINDAFKEKERRLHDVRERLQKLRENQGLLQHREQLELAVVWASVREREEGLERLEEKLAEARGSKQGELVTQLRQAEETAAALEEDIARLRRQQESANEYAATAVETLQENQAELRAAQALVKRLARETESARTEFADTQQEMEQMMTSIQQATQQAGGERQRELLAQLEAHKAKADELRQRREELEAQHEAAQQTVQEETEKQKGLDASAQQLGNSLRLAENAVQSLRRDRQELLSAGSNRLAQFGGTDMVNLCAAVEREKRRFSREPIGPIGAFLSLTDARWKMAAEVGVGPAMERWIVNSGADAKLLKELAAGVRMRRKLVIIVRSFAQGAYPVPARIAEAVRAPYILLRDLVVIDHPMSHVIDKVLMDAVNYERTVVCETDRQAQDVLYHHCLGPDIGGVVTVAGTKYGRSGPGKIATVTTNPSTRPPRLGGDMSTALRETELELTRQEARHRELGQQLESLTRERNESKAAAQRAHDQARQLKAQLNRLDAKMHDLNRETQAQTAALSEAEGADEDDEMRLRVAQLQADVASTQAAYDERKTSLAAARERESRASKAVDECQAGADAARKEMAKAKEELFAVREQRDEALQRKERAAKALDNMEATLAQAQQARDEFRRELEERRAVALQQCSEDVGMAACAAARKTIADKMRVRVEKQAARNAGKGATEEQIQALADAEWAEVEPKIELTPVIIENMLKGTQRMIQEVQDSAGGSAEELEAEETQVAASVAADATLVTNVREVYKRTAAALKRREEGYEALFQSVQKHVSQRFMNYMMRRKHEGKLRIYEDKQELKLLVKMNNSGKENEGGGAAAKADKAVKDMKQLSGGERSYTNVAFMLALGEYVESPFRCMDEYDVFMDAINRRVATETLLGFAVEKEAVQHIFLTPQDVTAIRDANEHLQKSRNLKLHKDFVRVMQMHQPRDAGGVQ